MWPKTRFSKKIILLVLGDAVLLYVALASALYLRYSQSWDPPLVEKHYFPFGIVFLVWLLVFGSLGLYDLRFMKNSKLFLYRLTRAMAANVALAIMFFYLTPAFSIEPRRNLLLIAIFATLYIFVWRYLFNLILVRAPSTKVLFFGLTKEAADLADFLAANPQLGHKPVAFFSPNGERRDVNLMLPQFASVDDLGHVVRDLGIDTIVTLREIREDKRLVAALFQVIPAGVAVVEFSNFHEALTGKVPLSLIGEVWFLENLVGIRKTAYELFKRALDLVVAVLATIPALASFPFIAAAVKLDSPGPVFYRQKRVGRHGKEFWVTKYRTMVRDAEKQEGLKSLKGLIAKEDPRHTRVGRILRKSYLDELPQIINILKGEMSFVGPRPERPEYISQFKQGVPFYEMRLLVPPGITGWAQVNMENDASVEDAPEKMQYDLYYVKNRSLVLDLLIILRTAFLILRREGR